METRTLDSISYEYNGPFLIKIDVDGAELEILKGAEKCLESTHWVIVEAWLSRVGQITTIMQEGGFVLWDIVDLAYMRGQLSQVDLIFASRKIMNNPEFKEVDPRQFKFKSSTASNYHALKEESLSESYLKKIKSF